MPAPAVVILTMSTITVQETSTASQISAQFRSASDYRRHPDSEWIRSSRDQGNMMLPSQSFVVFAFIVIALVLKAEDLGEVGDALKIAVELVQPIVAPLVLALSAGCVLTLCSNWL